MSNDMESMRVFADQLWKYMVPKLDSKFASNVSYFRAEVVSNPGNNKLEVQRPVENGTLTLPCVRAMSGAQAGQQVVALVMGSMSNAIIVGDGKLNMPGGGGDAGIANFQAQPDGSLVITLTNGVTFTATPHDPTKQNVLTFDDVPTQGSDNPVKSGGIYTALAGKQDTLTFDTTPTAGSSNPVTSEGIKTALDGKADLNHDHDDLYYSLTNGAAIPSDADLNDETYRTPGNYICSTSAVSHTVKHTPGYNETTLVNTSMGAFKLFVGYTTAGTYISQELRTSNDGAIYYRYYNKINSSWVAWKAVRGSASLLIGELSTSTANITDNTLITTSAASGETGTWYRRAAVRFWNYIKGKADAVYAAISHTHDASDIVSGILPAERGGTQNGNGYIQMGQKSGTTVGFCSTAEGLQTQSLGLYCHAEGYATTAGTTASNSAYAHSEGQNTTASGNASHSEGSYTTSSGGSSHAEGSNTVASGRYSHSEGWYTTANHRSQHVFGEYNTADNSSAEGFGRGNYVEIVGNGASESSRSNARTLDWSGNEWIAGALTQASDARLKEVQGEIPDLSSVRAVRFRWKNGDDKEHLGYLAQDVEGIAPYLVGVDSNGYKSLDYIALLTAKVEMLEREVMELKGDTRN